MPYQDLPTGVRLHYLDPYPEGGEAVLLLHGLGATGESWRLQFPALQAAGFRPIAPDLRGFGRSSYPGRWRVAEVAADAAALLDALDIPTAHVVGISMGGVLAQQVALDFPEKVKRLVLVNTFARLGPVGWRGWLYFGLRFVLFLTLGLERQAETVAQHVFPHPEQEDLRRELVAQIRQANPQAYRAAMLALARFDSTPRLTELRVPTLVVTGEADDTVPPHVQAVLAERIPQAVWWRVPGEGHGLTVTVPAAFNARLVDFLRGEM